MRITKQANNQKFDKCVKVCIIKNVWILMGFKILKLKTEMIYIYLYTWLKWFRVMFFEFNFLDMCFSLSLKTKYVDNVQQYILAYSHCVYGICITIIVAVVLETTSVATSNDIDTSKTFPAEVNAILHCCLWKWEYLYTNMYWNLKKL